MFNREILILGIGNKPEVIAADKTFFLFKAREWSHVPTLEFATADNVELVSSSKLSFDGSCR